MVKARSDREAAAYADWRINVKDRDIDKVQHMFEKDEGITRSLPRDVFAMYLFRQMGKR